MFCVIPVAVIGTVIVASVLLEPVPWMNAWLFNEGILSLIIILRAATQEEAKVFWEDQKIEYEEEEQAFGGLENLPADSLIEKKLEPKSPLSGTMKEKRLIENSSDNAQEDSTQAIDDTVKFTFQVNHEEAKASAQVEP